MKFTDITHLDDVEEDERNFKLLKKGKINRYRLKKRYIHKSGKIVWGDLFVALNPEELYNPEFSVLGMVTDITELREKGVRLKQRNENFKAMFVNNPQPMGIYSLHTFEILMVNTAFCRLFGYGREELLTLRITDLIGEEESNFKKFLEEHTADLIDGSTWDITTKWGERRMAETHSHRIIYKGIEARHVMFIDITQRKKNEIALLKSRDSIRQAQVIAKMGSYEYDPVADNAEWSKNMFRLLQVDPARTDLSLAFFKTLVHPEDRHQLDLDYEKPLWEGGKKKLEIRMLLPNGDYMWVEDHMEPFFYDNQLAYVRGVIIDITERKEKEQELLTFSNAVAQSPVLIVITNSQGIIVFVNDWFTKITGYQRDEVLGRNCRVLVSSQLDDSRDDVIWATVSSGHIWKGELVRAKKSGEIFWEKRSITPLLDEGGKIVNYLIIGEDITQKKKTEMELIDAIEKAEESVRLKSSFLAIVSHELRTQLNPIIGFSHILMEDPEEQMVQELAGLIHKSGEEMLRLIEDLFDLSFAKGHNLSLNNKSVFCVDLYTLARSSMEGRLMMSGKWDHIRPLFTHGSFCPKDALSIDSAKVLQVLSILFNNAVKFTQQGEIEFGMEIFKETRRIRFFVRDTGIGIEPGKASHIFDEFRQANDSASRNFGGLGVGLAISKYLVNILEGTLSVDSVPGSGSTFTLEMPVDFIEKQNKRLSRSRLAEDEFSNFNGKTILVVDDNPFVHEGIKRLLQAFDVTLIAAQNGYEAIQRVEEQVPDFILMDILMPEMGGIETTLRIRSLHPKVPIFALLAYFMPKDREKALEAGCDGVINKPVRRDILFNLLKKYLGEEKSKEVKEVKRVKEMEKDERLEKD